MKILTLTNLLKLILFVFCIIFIFLKIKDTNLSQMWSALRNPAYFWLVVVLFVPNYAFEIMKWKAIVRGIAHFDNHKLIKGVLTGQALSLFAPMMSGEYTGRVLHLHDQKRHHIFGSYLASVFFQSLTAFTLGILSSLYLGIQIKWWSRTAALALACGYLLLVVLLLFLFKNSRKWTKKLPLRFHNLFESYRLFDKKRMKEVLLLYFLRYAIIVLQFYYAYRAFGLEIGFLLSFLATTTILSAKNLFAGLGVLVELGVRQLTLAFVMQSIGFDPGLASLAGVWVWLVNIGLASAAGVFWVWKTKI